VAAGRSGRRLRTAPRMTAVTRGCVPGPTLPARSRSPVSPATAARRSYGTSRTAAWPTASTAATTTCMSSSARAAAIIPTWITPRWRRGFSGSAVRAPTGGPSCVSQAPQDPLGRGGPSRVRSWRGEGRARGVSRWLLFIGSAEP